MQQGFSSIRGGEKLLILITLIIHIIVSYDQNISLIFYVKVWFNVRLWHPSCVYCTAQRQYTAVETIRTPLKYYIIILCFSLTIIRISFLVDDSFGILSLPLIVCVCVLYSTTSFRGLKVGPLLEKSLVTLYLLKIHLFNQRNPFLS